VRLELSCGVGSLQQAPWWNADRRARDASREPRASADGRITRLSAFRFLFFFVARMERSVIRERIQARRPSPDFASLHPGYLVGKTRAQTKMRREKDFTFFTK
jgi:hypothetical protein